MADSKISALAAITTLAATDELVVASSGASKKITGANLRATIGIPTPVVNGQWVKGVGGVPVWAAIAVADVTGAEATANKAVANGYASLDATTKVPLAQLPAAALATYSVTPPGSPSDGDLWVLPVDTTNGIMWLFRYRAASASAYKWEFVGGALTYAAIATDEALGTAGVWTNVTTVGPDFVVPRAGDYRVDARCRASTPSTAATVHLGVANASVSLNAVGQWASSALGTPVGYTQLAAQSLLVGVGAAQTLRTVYQTSVAGMSFGQRTLTITPVRVS